VDAGTSIWLHRQVGAEFDAESLLEVVAQFLREQGRQALLTFDHDPRFVGSPSGRDFPSALVRFLLCIGVEPTIIPPHCPDLNAYVERVHRTLSQEWRLLQLPRTREQVWETTATFLPHYNHERPNQAHSCGNRPPRVACPAFSKLPAVPATVGPDRWLERLNKPAFARTIQSGGGITINHEDYDVSRALAGRRVMCVVNAAEKQFDLWQPGVRIKSVPIKGLYGRTVPFDEDVALMK
jgi:hypothetical protein